MGKGNRIGQSRGKAERGVMEMGGQWAEGQNVKELRRNNALAGLEHIEVWDF